MYHQNYTLHYVIAIVLQDTSGWRCRYVQSLWYLRLGGLDYHKRSKMCEVRCWLPDDKSVFMISWNSLTLLKYWLNIYPPLCSQEQLLHRVGTCQSVCLRCGFRSPRFESWRLLMRFICSKLMKGESVQAKVFVKPFLKLQETCWLFGEVCLRRMQGEERKSLCHQPVWQRGMAVPFLKWVLGCRHEVMKRV